MEEEKNAKIANLDKENASHKKEIQTHLDTIRDLNVRIKKLEDDQRESNERIKRLEEKILP